MSEQPGAQPEMQVPGAKQSPELGLVPKNMDEIPKVFDLVIMIDCTYSMDKLIDAAKKKSKEVIDKFIKKYPTMIFRVAFVGYRDFDDREQFNICDFTTDIQHVLTFIKDVIAYGGDDLAENLAGAFQETFRLSWMGDVMQIVLITDATPHGCEFHTATYSDSYPDGDPSGLDPKMQIQLLASQRKGLYVLRIVDNPSIDIMLTVFSEAYARGRVPGCKANFIIGDVADQMKPSPSTYVYSYGGGSEFDEGDSAYRCLGVPLPYIEDTERSCGDDFDEDYINCSLGPSDAATPIAVASKSVDDIFSDSLFYAISSQL